MARLLDAIAAGDGEVRGLAFAGEEVAGEWLGHVDFEGCTFEDCDLSGCTLDRASFEGCELRTCDLSNATLSTSFWRMSTVSDCRLTGCDLHEAIMRQNTFEGCALPYANLTDAKLEQITLRDCDLHEATLSNVRTKRLRRCGPLQLRDRGAARVGHLPRAAGRQGGHRPGARPHRPAGREAELASDGADELARVTREQKRPSVERFRMAVRRSGAPWHAVRSAGTACRQIIGYA